MMTMITFDETNTKHFKKMMKNLQKAALLEKARPLLYQSTKTYTYVSNEFMMVQLHTKKAPSSLSSSCKPLNLPQHKLNSLTKQKYNVVSQISSEIILKEINIYRRKNETPPKKKWRDYKKWAKFTFSESYTSIQHQDDSNGVWFNVMELNALVVFANQLGIKNFQVALNKHNSVKLISQDMVIWLTPMR